MHYSSGTPAQLGDIVLGKGYNLPHPIVGCVVGLTAGADSCNIKIATVKTKPVDPRNPDTTGFIHQAKVVDAAGKQVGATEYHATEQYLEFGRCADFELVHRPKAPAPS